MKQFFSTLLLLLFGAIALAQAPQAINYQGVARNASGVPYAGQQINVRLSIRTGVANGTIEYSETRTVETNQFGLFNVQIGSAGASGVQGNFAKINWASGTKFLQTEISVNAQPYVNLGTTQMMSVPYSMHSKEAKQLVFPFDTTVNINSTSAFTLRDTSSTGYPTMLIDTRAGNAISGSSANDDAIRATTHAKEKAAFSGAGIVDSSIGVRGSLHMNAKGGVGVLGDGRFDNIGVKGTSVNKAAVYGISTTNYGVSGESKDFVGVAGMSTNMAGVSGSSVYDIGVTGYSSTGKGGVYGGTSIYNSTYHQFGVMGEGFGPATGVIAKAPSTGTALLVDGKLRIQNVGTPLGAGKVLTSDAYGNATWQSPLQIAFRASDLRNAAEQTYAENTPKKVLFHQTVRYNIGNAYDGENAIFFVPVAGIYHFYAQVSWQGNDPWAVMRLKLLRNGTVSNIAETICGSYTDSDVMTTPFVTTTIALQANDAIWVELTQSNESYGSRVLRPGGERNWFTGHLLTRL